MMFDQSKIDELDNLEYPLLIWDDNEKDSSIILLNAQKLQKVVASHHHNLASLFERFAKLLELEDFFLAAKQGDRLAYSFKTEELTNGEFDFAYLEKQIPNALESLELSEVDMEENVREELINFYTFDLAASLQEIVFEEIVRKIINLAEQFRVGTIIASGELNFQQRFRDLFVKYAEMLGYDLRFIE